MNRAVGAHQLRQLAGEHNRNIAGIEHVAGRGGEVMRVIP
jgi:hypothetical protein